MDLAGSTPTPLTRNDSNDFDPVWSPDGSKIVFGTDLDGSGIL